MSSEHPGDVFDRSQPTADCPAVPAIKEALDFVEKNSSESSFSC
jgi:hypothetical protein